MDWMMAEYKSIHPGQPYLGSFTGKSVLNGGSLGRREATGKGVYFTLNYLLSGFLKENSAELADSSNGFAKTALEHSGKSLRLAVQGFGNVGSVAALEAYNCKDLNNKVVAVSDRNKTLYHPDGLDIPALIQYVANNRGDLPVSRDELATAGIQAEILDRESILYLDLDVLILAALEDQIRKDNVNQIKARIIVEGANAPITGEADQILSEDSVIIIPDILANAGGVIVSYFEWLQGRETQFYTEEEISRRLYSKMKSTMGAILPLYFQEKITLRQQCYTHAVSKLATSLYLQGKLY